MSVFFDFVRTSLLRSKKNYFLSRISNNVSCWLLLHQKKHVTKRSIFWQKPWTNPFAKCRLFSTLRELHFWVPKTLCSFQNIKKCFFIAFCWKKIYKKKVDFLTKTMDVRTSPFRSKKHSFLSRRLKNVSFWLSLLKRTDEGKVHFWRKTMD